MGFVIRDLTRRFGDNTVLKSVNMDAADGEFISLVGPSGVGKTTLLKILAELDQADLGSIAFSTPPTRNHPVIMVFQSFALFPHMTVLDNVAYGLKVRHVVRRIRRTRARKMLVMFGIADKADAYPALLSAGQKQRAAIARALVVEPRVLLLDEPFANLDKNLKGETARFIRETQQSFGITTVMVTHDQEEAFAVSDRIGVMIGGQLRQYDRPERLRSAPADRETAEFLGLDSRKGEST